MLNINYPQILDVVYPHLAPNRTESAAFLIWYLENYYRLDALDAVDSVCDKRGDKGVDGIYVNEDENTIEIFQCKISQKPASTVGDTGLKEFFGTLSQFGSRKSLENLIASAGDAEVARLITRLDLLDKVESYERRGVFVANVDIDSNGAAYLASTPQITFVGRTHLVDAYISGRAAEPVTGPASFDISGYSVAKYIVDKDTSTVIAPVKARELTKLTGIADQSLFALNVRGSLGRTQVNKDIVKSIKDRATHKLFPLFHNGITLIAESVEDTEDVIKIDKYYVVNGCQSLTHLFENDASLTDDLRVLTKFIKVKNVISDLSEKITRYSNNQNGVKPRDFKSNNTIQIRLQNEFRKSYPSVYHYEIKRGEIATADDVISNEMAGQYLMAFDLKEPWATHRRYQVFEDKHSELFGRPQVTADRIVLCHELAKAIDGVIPKINNKLVGKYLLTKFMMLYMIRILLDEDELGKDILKSPEKFVRTQSDRQLLGACIQNLLAEMAVDLNHEVDGYGADFDYRGNLRSAEWVKKLAGEVVGSHRKLVARGRLPSFKQEWDAASVIGEK
jgi:hypothetical protein